MISVHAIVDRLLAEDPTLTDVDAMTGKVEAAIPDDDRPALFTALLRGEVRLRLNGVRRATQTDGSTDHGRRDTQISTVGAAATSWKVAGYRDYGDRYRKAMEARVWLGGDYKRLADCTHVDLLRVVGRYCDLIAANRAQRDRYRRLAALLAGSDDHVSDIAPATFLAAWTEQPS